MTITSSFGAHTTASEVIAGHDLTGKIALVTGASSGIGIETARALLSAHAEVILAVRDTAKGEQVAQQLRDSTGNPQPHVLRLDLGSLASVREAAEQFHSRWSKLDLLINNAGIMATPQGYTPDGFEQQFGTNHLGHFLLTMLLLPALQAATPARVVELSSSANRRADIDFDDINFRQHPYDKWQAYGQSKTANVLFAVGFNKRYGSLGITANAVNPGGIRTGLQQHLTREDMLAMGWLDEQGNQSAVLDWKTPEEGASTSVWAAVGHELEGIGGLYLEDCSEGLSVGPETTRGHGYELYAVNPDHAERLWTLSQEMVGR